MKPAYVIPLIIVLLLRQEALAQQDTLQAPAIYRVILKDGLEILGTMGTSDTSSVEFTSLSKIAMVIPRSQITSIVRLSGTEVEGKFQQSDPNYTRLFFSPTGRPLKNGQGYFALYELFFPFLAVGIGDVVTLAGGVSILPGAKGQIVYVAPKITPVHLKNIDLAAGVLYMHPTTGNSSGLGIVYTVGTYGSVDRALTVGLGWGFSSSELANKPVLMLGGELRISGSIKIITENWIPPEGDLVIYSFGFRFFGEKLAADLGFIRPSQFTSDGFPFVPWLGFSYNFGGK